MTSTNPRDVVARIVDPTGWELFDELVRVRCLLPHEQPSTEYLEEATRVCEARTKASITKADTILSTLQPAVSEEAVDVALRALMSARGEMLSTAKAEMFRDALAAPNSQVWSYLLKVALTAALPFMMGDKANG